MPERAQLSRVGPPRRAVVVGAGSFGTALAVLLVARRAAHRRSRRAPRAGRAPASPSARTALPAGASRCRATLRDRARSARPGRAPTYVFLAVPSRGLGEVIDGPGGRRARPARGHRLAGQGARAARRRAPPTVAAARRSFGPTTGSPAWAVPPTRRRWSARARRWSRPPATRGSPSALAQVFTRAGVVCEQSNDPVGVELAGAAKNAAALAAGATEAQGLNAAGAAAGHIFAEVWRYAEAPRRAARVDDRPGRHRRPGGDRARAAEPQPPRRRAAGRGRPRRRDPRARRPGGGVAGVGARCSRARCGRAGVEAPVTTALGAA